jgi:hypothetical protein
MILRSGSTTATPSEIASRISSAWIIIPTHRTAESCDASTYTAANFWSRSSDNALEIVRTITSSYDSER